MSFAPRTGLLLLNLGTPESPAPSAVRPYLREFLMDRRVLDVPFLQRWAIVNLLILPRRPRTSGEAYAKIWGSEGSPLLVHGRALAAKVSARLPSVEVELGMRYGRPSTRSALERLRARAVDRIVVFPLYPHYSSAATGSSLECVYREAGRLWNVPALSVVPPFYDHPGFIEAFAREARPVIERGDPEIVFFSFHGLPERQLRKSDETGRHCFASADCCERVVEANRNCYRAQCLETARRIGDALGLPEERRRLCFQSRLGRTPWIRPYTDELLRSEPRAGVRRAAILSPGFVADCLETLEELGIRGAATWRENGGERLDLIPCPNSSDVWADAVVRIASEHSSWLSPLPQGASLRG